MELQFMQYELTKAIIFHQLKNLKKQKKLKNIKHIPMNNLNWNLVINGQSIKKLFFFDETNCAPNVNIQEYGIDNDPNNVIHSGILGSDVIKPTRNSFIINNIEEGDSIYLGVSIIYRNAIEFEYVYDDISGQRYTINDLLLWDSNETQKFTELQKIYGDDNASIIDNMPLQYRISGGDNNCNGAFKFPSTNDTINLHVKMKKNNF